MGRDLWVPELISIDESRSIKRSMGISLGNKQTSFKRELRCVIGDIYSNFGQCKGKPSIPRYKIVDIKEERALGFILQHYDNCPDNWTMRYTVFTDTTTIINQPAIPKPIKQPSGKWLFKQLESCGWYVIDFKAHHDGILYIVRRLEKEDFAK